MRICILTKGLKNTVQNLERFCKETIKKSAQRVGRVLTSLIKKKYPKGKDSISFVELLDWGLWSSYIRIYCKQMFHTGVFVYGAGMISMVYMYTFLPMCVIKNACIV